MPIPPKLDDKLDRDASTITHVFLEVLRHIDQISQSSNAPLAMVTIFAMFLAFMLFIAVLMT